LIWSPAIGSDYVCPFCYLELPELARLARERETVGVVWCAFELRPEPEPTLDPDEAYLHRVWNASRMDAIWRMTTSSPTQRPV
jgi:predicted DsbA family dithiol-disulfide isomerase